MIDLLEKFKEFVKEKELKLSVYELRHMMQILADYPENAPKPLFNCKHDAVYLEVKTQSGTHWLRILRGCIVYCDNDWNKEYSGYDGCTEYSIIAKFYKAIQK